MTDQVASAGAQGGTASPIDWSNPSPVSAATGSQPGRIGRYRWMICLLLFAAATINYMDRQVLGVLKPELSRSLGWDEINYGNIVTAFQIAYAIGMLSMGRLLDRLGTRVGFAVAVCFWGLASMSHAL